MPLRGLPLRLLLALLLVFTQQQSVLHELGHVFDRLGHQTEWQQPHKDVCATCVAFAGIHHAADTDSPSPLFLPQRPALLADVQFGSAPTVFIAAYLSRAPPTQS